MTQSNQHITGHKPYSFFQDSEIEDWFKKNHTLSYLKFKSKLEPLEERIYKCETLNLEMEGKINQLIEDSYFISKKINNLDNSVDLFLEIPKLKYFFLIIAKATNFLFRSGLSLFPIISIYALINPLIHDLKGSSSLSLVIAAFFGISLSYFSARIIQSLSHFYWSELREGMIEKYNQRFFLLFTLIVVLESFMGVYGIIYLLQETQLISRASGVNLFLLLSPTLFSLINVSNSFGEEMKRHERLKTANLISKRDATNQLIEDLQNRVKDNYKDLHFYRIEYNKALSGNRGLFDYLDREEDNIKSLYGSIPKMDGSEDLTIRVHFDRDNTNSYYELNNHGVAKTSESNNEALKQASQIINKLIPGQQQSNEELHYKLTVYESADILNVSIPYIVNLVESGKIPSQGNGVSYLIDLNDLLAYKQESDAGSRHALAELAREAQELDMGY